MGKYKGLIPIQIFSDKGEMKLLEEYKKRHNLDFGLAYHTKHANIFLKGTPKQILTIKWDDSIKSPGYYVFRFLEPNHNGYLDGKYFAKPYENYYQYDDYLQFITTWARGIELEPVRPEQTNLAIWEMFLYCFDAWIAEHDLEEMVFATVGANLSSNAIDNLLKKHPRVHK